MAASRRLATFGAKKLQAANAPGNWLPSMALSILRKTGSSFAKTHLKSSSPKTLQNNNRQSTKRNKAGIVLNYARFTLFSCCCFYLKQKSWEQIWKKSSGSPLDPRSLFFGSLP